MRQRVRLLEKAIKDMEEKTEPLKETAEGAGRTLELEYLSQELSVYLEWKEDMASYKEKVKEQEELEARLKELLTQNVDQWKNEREALLSLCDQRKGILRQMERRADDLVCFLPFPG